MGVTPLIEDDGCHCCCHAANTAATQARLLVMITMLEKNESYATNIKLVLGIYGVCFILAVFSPQKPFYVGSNSREFLKYNVWICVWIGAKKSVDVDKTHLQGRGEPLGTACSDPHCHQATDVLNQICLELIQNEC